ncbi:hypothetical protein SISSUDRAFT_515083 [Sistotremastrum suecicum HHB10207 ss-3]|uniref:Adhesin domain-containing protein n=1 Tax=Sistotremastrum suecicum HHB10207 ss-3 TaxID=1314776 RepID=A0A166IPT0_9AGAM|nr:hypothetical protein SISSUDRAFT_515083 [Sistotremastrum suecicum HHB10207 ss-3]
MSEKTSVIVLPLETGKHDINRDSKPRALARTMASLTFVALCFLSVMKAYSSDEPSTLSCDPNWLGLYNVHSDHTAARSLFVMRTPHISLKASGISRGEVFFRSSAAVDKVTVDIRLTSPFPDAVSSVKICQTSGSDTLHQGLIIHTPANYLTARLNISYMVIVTFPSIANFSTSGQPPLRIESFETHLPSFRHHLANLSHMYFESFYLSAGGAAIHSEYLSAGIGELHTSGGPITGKYRTNRTLTIDTSNTVVDIETLLESNPYPLHTTSVQVKTSNGRVNVVNNLMASGSSWGGNFEIGARTSNFPLSVTVKSSPISAVLGLETFNANGPSIVSLHPSYEGSFLSQTSNNHEANIVQKKGTLDPSGQGVKGIRLKRYE